MKELTTQIIVDPSIRIEQQQIKKKGLIGRMKIHKGQKCFELNLVTGMICTSDVRDEVDLKGNVKHKLIIKEECIYTVAINLANAKRKFINRLYKYKAEHQ